MYLLKLILRDLSIGLSLNEIERRRKLARTSIRTYKERAELSGFTYEELIAMSDGELQSIMVEDCGHKRIEAEKDDFLKGKLQEYASRMTLPRMTYKLLYKSYRLEAKELAYGETRFRLTVQKYIKDHDYKYHNVLNPAFECQVDFAGDVLWIIDPRTGECKKVYVLIVILSYSKLVFAIGMLEMTMENLFNGISKAMTYFGGVTKTVISDNMKQWVSKPDRHDPTFTDAASEWALYYNTELKSTRVRRPRDKGAVEGGVNVYYVTGYAAILTGEGSGVPEVYYSLEDINARLEEISDQINGDVRPGRSRREIYEKEEKPYMIPLPEQEYTYMYSKVMKEISSTYHIGLMSETEHYSVPYKYIGQAAVVRYNYKTVEIYVGGERVATHDRRLNQGNNWETKKEHMPTDHREWRKSSERNAARYMELGQMIGPFTAAAMESLLRSRPYPEQAYKTCGSVLALGRKFTNPRLEKACQRLSRLGIPPSYRALHDILSKNVDLAPINYPDEPYMPNNEDVRGPEEYT